MSITAASLHGAAARLRPILMTSLAMIIGLLPMMFAFGVGANGNRALGTTAVGGMFIGMICQIFVVPALFRISKAFRNASSPSTSAIFTMPTQPPTCNSTPSKGVLTSPR